jgi:AraC-like DNA-binding protein
MTDLLTTASVSQSERLDYWREVICDVFVDLDADPIRRTNLDAFDGSIVTGRCGELQISEVRADAQHVRRSMRQIAKAPTDDLLISVQNTGVGSVEQAGRRAHLQPGDLALYDSREPYTLHFDHRFHQTVFQLPRSLLVGRCFAADRLTAVRIPGDEALGGLVVPFLRNFASSHDRLAPDTKTRLTGTALDLIASALASISGEAARPAALATLRRQAAKRFIEDHLGDPDLCPSVVAAGVRISVRYLHRLFADEQRSVGGFIRERRLERAREDLADPAMRMITITEIGMRWGFRDSAHFSRAFKQQHGASPSAYRAGPLTSPTG